MARRARSEILFNGCFAHVLSRSFEINGSQLIENEAYLYACGRYIEENPVKAGLVPSAQDWPHSSAGHYLLGKQDPLIDAYEFDPEKRSVPELGQEALEKGIAVGSELFLLEVEEGLVKELTVP